MTAALAQPPPSNIDVIDAAQSLPPDLAIIKMENESIMAMAAKRPRDKKAILADLKSQIEAYPTFAKAAKYVKPVGKDPKTGRMKFAEGLSIRAAEAIAASFGFNRVRTAATPIDADTVMVEATFVDYQTGRIWQDSTPVSKKYKARGGGTRVHSDDRFYNVVIKAEKSKCVREVVLRIVDPGLKSELDEMIETTLAELMDEKQQSRLVNAFAAKKVGVADLEKVQGKKLDAFTNADRVALQKMWTAIDTGESTAAELFGVADDGNGKSGNKSPEDLAGEIAGKPQDEEYTGPMPDAEPEPKPEPKKRTPRKKKVNIEDVKTEIRTLVSQIDPTEAAKLLRKDEDGGFKSWLDVSVCEDTARVEAIRDDLKVMVEG
jgi:hypothetical protein